MMKVRDNLLTLALWLCFITTVGAQSSINSEVNQLGKPQFWESIAIESLPIATQSDQARAHIEEGMGLLAAAWDFEAYRHFSAALQEDEESLMAHSGTVLSLLRADAFFKKQLSAAVFNLKKYAAEASATEYERNFAQGILAMISGKSEDAKVLLTKEISPEEENTVFNLLLSEFLSADGYTKYGSPKSGQKKVIEEMSELGKSHRDSPTLLSFWLMANSKDPSGRGFLNEQVLPFSRTLTRLEEKFPPYFYLRGYYEQKCGNSALALESYLNALSLYEKYLSEGNIDWIYCNGLLECVIGATRAYVSLEQYDQALSLIVKYKQKELPAEWINSQIGKLFLWDFKTLETRVLMAKPGVEFRTLLGSLPDANYAKRFEGTSLVMLYWRALVFHLNGIELAKQNKVPAAQELYNAFLENRLLMENGREFAKQKKSLPFYEKALGVMKILEVEFKANLVLAEDPTQLEDAVTWWRSAADLQQLETSHTEPFLFYSVEERAGRHFLKMNDYEEALYYFGKGYERWLNHLGCLRGAETALQKLGREVERDEVSAHLFQIEESIKQ